MWKTQLLLFGLLMMGLGGCGIAPKSGSLPGDFPEVYVAGRTEVPLVIDGRLDELGWRTAPWTIAFRDIEGDAKPDPRFITRAKMLWDDEYFYVGADMAEPHVWGSLTKRDAIIYNDNDFEVFIDPDGDNYDYYELEVNALNTQFDLMLTKPYRCGGAYDIGWDIDGLKTAVDIKGTLNDSTDIDDGWSMEIAIPWESLRSHANRSVPPVDGDQWPVNFSRVQWQHQLKADGSYERIPGIREDNWTWTQQDAIDMHRPEYWGLVQFSDGPPGTVVFRAPPDAAAWTLLRRVHHAAELYRAEHEAWPTTMTELDGRYEPLASPGLGSPRISVTEEGFMVEVEQSSDTGSRRYRFGPGCLRSVAVIQTRS